MVQLLKGIQVDFIAFHYDVTDSQIILEEFSAFL